MTAIPTPAPSLDARSIARLLADLVIAELRTSRGQEAPLPAPHALAPDTPLGAGGLGTDSIELMRLASAVDEFFHLHDSGVEDYLLARRTLDQWVQIVLASRQECGTHLTFRTSGSTGEPRRCTHRIDLLAEEMHEMAGVVGPRGRVLLCAPSHHIYGFLFGVILPQVLGAETLDARHWSPGRLRRELRSGDLLVSFPTHWAALARSGVRLPGGVLGTTSTAPCPPQLIAELRALGLAGMVEIYGASETAGLGYRTSPEEPYTLFGHWQVIDRERQGVPVLVRAGLSGPAEAPDSWTWSGERTFRPAGRRDGAVQVGGVNVFPEVVGRRLRAHPAVADCAVRPLGTGAETRLKAFVVLEATQATDEARAGLENWIRQTFPAPERPVSLMYGDRLPTAALGKSADWP